MPDEGREREAADEDRHVQQQSRDRIEDRARERRRWR